MVPVLKPARVLFVCVGNASRSQIAEAWLSHLGGACYDARSAGTHPSGLHALAVRAMGEVGVDISGRESKGLASFSRWPCTILVALDDAVLRACRAIRAGQREHWPIPDPGWAAGDDEERLQVFREVRDQLRERVVNLMGILPVPDIEP